MLKRENNVKNFVIREKWFNFVRFYIARETKKNVRK